MSKTQQTVENFHPTNPVVDLRPEGHEDKARQTEIDREKLLAQQKILHQKKKLCKMMKFLFRELLKYKIQLFN